MRKNGRALILSALCVLVAMGPSVCEAQTSASAAAVVSLVVVRGMSVSGSESMNFSVLKKDANDQPTPSQAPDIASFEVSGQPWAAVTVGFPGTVTLQSSTGDKLGFTPTIPVWNTENSQISDSQFFPSIKGGKASFNSAGMLYVWFGGAINTDKAISGAYSGKYTITITY